MQELKTFVWERTEGIIDDSKVFCDLLNQIKDIKLQECLEEAVSQRIVYMGARAYSKGFRDAVIMFGAEVAYDERA